MGDFFRKAVKLLNTSTVNPEDAEKVISYLKKWWLEEAEKLIFDTYGLQVTNPVDMKVVIAEDLGSAAAFVRASYTVDSSSPTGVTGKGKDMELHIGLKHAHPLQGQNPGPFPQYVDRVVAHEMVHAMMAQTMNFGELTKWFKEGAAEAVHGADERLKYTIHNNGGGDAGLVKVLSSIGNGSDADWAGGQDDYAAAYVAVKYLHQEIDGNGIKDVMTYLTNNQTANLDDTLQHFHGQGRLNFSDTQGWLTAVKNDIKTISDLNTKAGIQLDPINVPETDTGSIKGGENAESIIPDPADPDSVAEKDQPLSGFHLIWDTANAKPLTFQIGANMGQSITLNTEDMTANGLGISDVNVLNHGSAKQAISTYDDAIERVSAYRGKLGAMQNRLEHTIRNLDNSAENLTAAESRIRDVNMAHEMMNYTKTNILQQAAQSMLAQANSRPQAILQLLG